MALATLDRRVTGVGSDGRSTPSPLTVDALRTLFRGLALFRAAHEDLGIDMITDNNGVSWSLWDIEALYRATQEVLPTRQAQAIRLFLVEGLFEADAAERMGISRTNPVGMYATDGLARIVTLVEERRIKGYRIGGD